MKIEMGESLFYSWLREVKECQIVQTNWTTAKQWKLYNKDVITNIKEETEIDIIAAIIPVQPITIKGSRKLNLTSQG